MTSALNRRVHRVLRVLVGDANTWIGRRVDGTEAMEEVVGPFHRGKQTAAATCCCESVLETGTSVTAGAVSTCAGPHATADGASPRCCAQR